LVPQSPSPTPNVPPTNNDWDSLFCPMFDEYFNPSPSVVQPVLVAGVQELVVLTSTPSSTRIDQDTPSTSTDKSKITRKQSKASKHGHENQKSTKRSQRSKALANFLLQGPILQFPKVIYNLKKRKEREGPNVQSSQTTTVLTVKEEAGNPFTIHPSSPIFTPW
ncbi:hypothetical protein Tco_1581701, partial [Tanacetum coccineum]